MLVKAWPAEAGPFPGRYLSPKVSLMSAPPRRVSTDTSPAVKQLIPPQYNSRSTLTKTITAGTNKLDFDLKSK